MQNRVQLLYYHHKGEEQILWTTDASECSLVIAGNGLYDSSKHIVGFGLQRSANRNPDSCRVSPKQGLVRITRPLILVDFKDGYAVAIRTVRLPFTVFGIFLLILHLPF